MFSLVELSLTHNVLCRISFYWLGFAFSLIVSLVIRIVLLVSPFPLNSKFHVHWIVFEWNTRMYEWTMEKVKCVHNIMNRFDISNWSENKRTHKMEIYSFAMMWMSEFVSRTLKLSLHFHVYFRNLFIFFPLLSIFKILLFQV